MLKEKRWVPCVKAVPGSLNAEKRTLEATITTSEKDRDGEVVQASAFESRIDSFLKNPVMLWMHNPMEPPIGKANGVEFKKDGIEAELQFRREGESELADSVFNLYEQGILSSFSIGFKVFEMTEAAEDDDGKAIPPTITDAELFEVSAVTIPANPGAVAKYQKGAELLAQPMYGHPQKVVSRELYSPITTLELLKRAPGEVEKIIDRVARGDQVSKELLDAVQRLKLSLLGMGRIGNGADAADVAALDQLAATVRSLSTKGAD